MNFHKTAGEFYGYPECCITWFEKRMNGEISPELTPTQWEIETYDGFIPCPSCAEKIKQGKITHKDLIKERIAKSPYPQDNLPEFKKYLKKKGYQTSG